MRRIAKVLTQPREAKELANSLTPWGLAWLCKLMGIGYPYSYAQKIAALALIAKAGRESKAS